jgi:hypothetical protein
LPGLPALAGLPFVFSGFECSRRRSFDDLKDYDVQFETFVPLQAGVNAGLFRIVFNAAISESAKVFPIFRTGMVDPTSGRVEVWWLWDGDKEWRVGQLTPEQRRFPIRGVINDALLKERISSSWTSDADSR